VHLFRRQHGRETRIDVEDVDAVGHRTGDSSSSPPEHPLRLLRMRRCLPIGILCAVLLAAPAYAAGHRAPSGTRFYKPSAKLVKGGHGSLIWARRQTGPQRLKGAAKAELVLYRSRGVRGKTVAVSGDVAIPKGKAPKHGWPVITWAHGTTGIADACAPTRLKTTLSGIADLTHWLKAGYAIVRTDYQGLGTPGVHPDLNGDAEGRSVLDIVRAARKLDRRIGKRIVIAGHSQGGHAALWAADLAPKYTPELKVRGTVAFAPASHIGEQFALARSINTPGGGTTGLGSLIIRGADVADPALGIAGLLSPQASALYGQTLSKCSGELDVPSSWGGLAPSQIFKPDADLTPLIAFLNAKVDPEDLRIKTPVRVEQGTADPTVLPPFTDDLVKRFTANHVPVSYKTYAGIDHGHVVTGAPAADATKWIRARLP
jgi:pimeloyl-ACP methyl ester carboxylesterase